MRLFGLRRIMQGLKRRLTYVVLYEGLALVLLSITFNVLSDEGLAHAGVLGALTVLIAVSWNFIYNLLFECWEARQTTRGRSLVRRVGHAAGFEVSLLLLTLPLFAWWLQLSLFDAFLLDAGLTLFFVFFTFIYNWGFDRVFGLPLAAQ
jgi:uncharacterized membrane protein